MRRFTVAAAAVVAVIVLAGCSATISTGTGTTIKAWPTAEPLTGPVPVGRWACFFDEDMDAMRASNQAEPPSACFILYGGAIAFHPGGIGYDLKQYVRGS